MLCWWHPSIHPSLKFFFRPDDMRDTAVRLIDSSGHIMYSSEEEKQGDMLPRAVSQRISGFEAAISMDDDYLITINKCADKWYVICSAPTQIILAERKDFIRSTVIVTIIAAVIAIILGTILSIHATNPVNSIVTTLNRQASIDRLTGILSKLSFEESAKLMPANSKENERHCVILLDVDNFKGVNDSLFQQDRL